MSDIKHELDKIRGRISEPSFLKNEGLSNEVGIHVDGGIGHPGCPILTPESCPQRFKLLLFCRVIKSHIWFLRILKFGWLQISETGGGPRQRGRAQGAKKPTATPLWA